TLLAMSPFLVALAFTSVKPDDRMKLHSTASFYDVPLVAMRIIRYLLALFFIVYFISSAYNSLIGWGVGVVCFLIIILFASRQLTQRYAKMEEKFLHNLNIREDTRLGRNNNLIDDMHQAYIEVGPYTPFVGDKLKDSGLRRDYGVSVSSIQRGDMLLPLPSVEARIFPGDVLGVIGTDDQIKHLNDDMQKAEEAMRSLAVTQPECKLQSIRLTEQSPIIGKPLAQTNIREDYYSMIVKVRRGDEYVNPAPDTVLQSGDVVWVVGDPTQFEQMR
ncbi:MAG: hypothetical protein K2H75_02730, partial [Muribaculaceae bacterium]|nr:hypothetical protein [Muribaculaceae bacterium]